MLMYLKFRDVHLYLGLIMLIPAAVICATGIALNHEDALKLKPEFERHNFERRNAEDEKSAVAHSAHRATAAADRPSSLISKPGSWSKHAGVIDDALAAAADIWGEAPLEKIELKDQPGYGLVVIVKTPKESGIQPEEIVWSVADRAIVHKKGDKAAGWNWGKIIKELHTGKLFSGNFGFLWSDASAVSILLLLSTGIVLYIIPYLLKC